LFTGAVALLVAQLPKWRAVDVKYPERLVFGAVVN